jgi:ribosomal protein S18 acetylase RimI-like enzyme
MSAEATAVQHEAKWRHLLLSDIDSLLRIADQIHSDLPESREVFEERAKLFPDGCFALVHVTTNELCGYAISHPIKYRQPPALNCLLEGISSHVDQYYIHDVAILPDYQGRGHAQQCIEKIFAVAKPYTSIGLVSVYGTTSFWGRHGFKPPDVDESMAKKLKDYGDAAQWLECRND